MPLGTIIDLVVSEFGANALLKINNINRIYYIGKSANSNPYDLGIKILSPKNWTLLETLNA